MLNLHQDNEKVKARVRDFSTLPVEVPPGLFSLKTGADFGPLGTNWEITQPQQNGRDLNNQDHSLFNRLRKWARQSVYRDLISTKAARFCHRAMAPIMFQDQVSIPRRYVEIYKSSSDHFGFGGLITCGSVWVCPVCASKISEHRRLELRQALDSFKEKFSVGNVFHLTLTAPHHVGESLKSLLEKMAHARRLMLNRKPWKEFSRWMMVKGEIRALEVTHGHKNGWHVHYHVLLFSECGIYQEGQMEEMKEDVFSAWRSACITAGLEAPSEKHGVDLAYGDSASDYVSKWGADHEMTKGHMKKGFDGNFSPFDFLDKVSEGDQRYGALFQEFARAFKSRHQLVWSRGLRALLEVVNEKTDDEIADGQDPDSELFAQISREEWAVILRKEKRGQVLEACRGGIESLKNYIHEIVSEARDARSYCTGAHGRSDRKGELTWAKQNED
jgi:hypothetical protein